MWNDIENMEENCEMTWNRSKKIMKKYEKYWRKVGWIKRNDMENMEERQVE